MISDVQLRGLDASLQRAYLRAQGLLREMGPASTVEHRRATAAALAGLRYAAQVAMDEIDADLGAEQERRATA